MITPGKKHTKWISGADAAAQRAVATWLIFLAIFATKPGEKTCFGWGFGEESGSKSGKGYTPFTTFPLFLLLFSLFFSPSPPPSSTVGEKLPFFVIKTARPPPARAAPH